MPNWLEFYRRQRDSFAKAEGTYDTTSLRPSSMAWRVYSPLRNPLIQIERPALRFTALRLVFAGLSPSFRGHQYLKKMQRPARCRVSHQHLREEKSSGPPSHCGVGFAELSGHFASSFALSKACTVASTPSSNSPRTVSIIASSVLRSPQSRWASALSNSANQRATSASISTACA